MVPWPFPRASSRGSIDSSGRHASSALSADGDQEDPVASAQEEYELNVALAISESANEAHQVPLPSATPPTRHRITYHPQLNAFTCGHKRSRIPAQSRQLDDEAALASAKRLSLASGSLPSEHGVAEALSCKYWDSDWCASTQCQLLRD